MWGDCVCVCVLMCKIESDGTNEVFIYVSLLLCRTGARPEATICCFYNSRRYRWPYAQITHPWYACTYCHMRNGESWFAANVVLQRGSYSQPTESDNKARVEILPEVQHSAWCLVIYEKSSRERITEVVSLQHMHVRGHKEIHTANTL